MDLSVFIPLITSWVTYLFPSLGEYLKYLGPILMTLITLLGIFTNYLPEVGHQYPVPDVASLQAELGESGGYILKIAQFTRKITITVNWFIATAVYSWFYTCVTKFSSKLTLFKKK